MHWPFLIVVVLIVVIHRLNENKSSKNEEFNQ